MLEYMGARKDYESRIVDMQDCITTLEGSVKQQKEIEKAKDRMVLALAAKDCHETRAKVHTVHREEARETEKACRCGLSAPRSQATGWKRRRGRGGRGVAGIVLECHS
jgi:hypothetical protein